MLRKLADSGQAILCTIHQPSAPLFQTFDQILLLGKNGTRSDTLIGYFESHGARPCKVEENPAEWILDVTGSAVGSTNATDWSALWRDSTERQKAKSQLAEMMEELSRVPPRYNARDRKEFAMAVHIQMYVVTRRIFEEYWRTPSYLYSKLFLCVGAVSSRHLES